MKIKTVEINETIMHEGVNLLCVIQNAKLICRNCYFRYRHDCLLFNCAARDRKDKKDVIFIKTKQVNYESQRND